MTFIWSIFFSPVPDTYDFLTGSYNMIPFSDYEQQQLLFNRIRNIGINVTRRVICYDQPIYDDMRLEVVEYFGMTMTVRGMPLTTVPTEVRSEYDQVAILIVDDDGEKNTHTNYNLGKLPQVPVCIGCCMGLSATQVAQL